MIIIIIIIIICLFNFHAGVAMECGFTVTAIFIIIAVVSSLAAFDEIWLFVS